MKFVKLIAIFILVSPHLAQSQEIVDWEQKAKELEENRQLWNSKNIHSYSFLMDGGCQICGWYFPAKVVVEHDIVVSVLDTDTGAPLRQMMADGRSELALSERRELFKSIEELFTFVDDAIRNHYGTTHPGVKASNLQVEYDEVYGYPRVAGAYFDRRLDAQGSESMRTDSGLGYRLSQLSPLP